jgi:DNA-directed RNA polymerase specialized sigma24 family protein
MSTIAHVSSDWQTGFLSVLPAIQTQARIRFRKLPARTREDAVQEAIASACASYQRLAAKGKLHAAHASTLANFAVNFVRNGRHVGGRQDAARDVMSPACQKRRGICIVSASPAGYGTDGWQQIVIADRKASIPDVACFRVDFAEFLKILNRRDRKIISALSAGETTSGVAEQFRITPGRVSQLRRRYERDWCVFQGEAA